MSIRPSEFLVCPHCDVLHRAVGLKRYEVAACVACGRILARHHAFSVDRLLAVAVTAALVFAIANAYPLMSIEVAGIHTQATIWNAALLMLHGWTAWPAAMLALTMFVLPLVQIALMLWVLSFARLGRCAPGIRVVLVVLHRSRPWSMTEVFLLGTLVAIVKLSGWVHVTSEIGAWGLASLTVLLAVLSLVDSEWWWSLTEARP